MKLYVRAEVVVSPCFMTGDGDLSEDNLPVLHVCSHGPFRLADRVFHSDPRTG